MAEIDPRNQRIENLLCTEGAGVAFYNLEEAERLMSATPGLVLSFDAWCAILSCYLLAGKKRQFNALKRQYPQYQTQKSGEISPGFIDECSPDQYLDRRPMDFQGFNLDGVAFTGGLFENASFCAVNLRYARFFSCDLRRANFRRAKLQGALFVGCNLRGACFDEAWLPAPENFRENEVDIPEFWDAYVKMKYCAQTGREKKSKK